MKHNFKILAIAVIIVSTITISCNITSHTEVAKGVNFANYKTFAWAEPQNKKKADRADNDIVDNNIKNAASEELTKRGWAEVDNNPDVLLNYGVAVQRGNKHETDPVYSYPHTQYFYWGRRIYSVWYPSTLIGTRSYNVPFHEGQLTLNMVDAKTNKLIWQGWAQGEINSSKVNSKEVEAQVKSIFKKFNYPVNK